MSLQIFTQIWTFLLIIWCFFYVVILPSEMCVCSSIKSHFCISIYFKMSVLHYLQRENRTTDFKELITILPLFLYNGAFHSAQISTSPCCLWLYISMSLCERWNHNTGDRATVVGQTASWPNSSHIRLYNGRCGYQNTWCLQKKIIPHKAYILLMWPQLGEEKRKLKQLDLSCDI